MKTTTFTQFRRKAKSYFDAVERGDTVRVLRHGKLIAEVIPVLGENILSWKRPGLKLSIPGVSLTKEILKARRASKR